MRARTRARDNGGQKITGLTGASSTCCRETKRGYAYLLSYCYASTHTHTHTAFSLLPFTDGFVQREGVGVIKANGKTAPPCLRLMAVTLGSVTVQLHTDTLWVESFLGHPFDTWRVNARHTSKTHRRARGTPSVKQVFEHLPVFIPSCTRALLLSTID